MATSTEEKVISQNDMVNFIEQTVNIAIDEELGSPMMIKLAKEKNIQKGDVSTWEDLAEHFGAVNPQDFRKSVTYTTTKWAFREAQKPNIGLSLAETGGTTGPPKKTVYLFDALYEPNQEIDPYDIHTPFYNLLIREVHELMEEFNVPRGMNWLAIVPTGPHAIGKWAQLRWERDFVNMMFMIDLDPRFVKKAMMKDPKIGGMYVQHLRDQVENIVKQEFPLINGIFTTGVLIEQMYPLVEQLATKGNLKAILHGGTPMPEETFKILTEDLKLPVVGFYGQSLFGTLFQSPELDGYNIDYYPHRRMNTFIVSDPSDISTRVDYGEIGTVVAQRVSPECVIPALVQDGDLGTRIKPRGRHNYADGVRNPHRDLRAGQQMGVY